MLSFSSDLFGVCGGGNLDVRGGSGRKVGLVSGSTMSSVGSVGLGSGEGERMKKGGMDRKSWIAAGACFLLLLLYPKIVAHFYPPAPQKKLSSGETNTVTRPEKSVPTPDPILTPKETLAPGSVTRAGAEQTAILENKTLRLVLTTWGGEIGRASCRERVCHNV